MFEFERMRMQAEPARRVRACAVARVAGDRMADCGELSADLVLSPGFEFELY